MTGSVPLTGLAAEVSNALSSGSDAKAALATAQGIVDAHKGFVEPTTTAQVSMLLGSAYAELGDHEPALRHCLALLDVTMTLDEPRTDVLLTAVQLAIDTALQLPRAKAATYTSVYARFEPLLTYLELHGTPTDLALCVELRQEFANKWMLTKPN